MRAAIFVLIAWGFPSVIKAQQKNISVGMNQYSSNLSFLKNKNSNGLGSYGVYLQFQKSNTQGWGWESRLNAGQFRNLSSGFEPYEAPVFASLELGVNRRFAFNSSNDKFQNSISPTLGYNFFVIPKNTNLNYKPVNTAVFFSFQYQLQLPQHFGFQLRVGSQQELGAGFKTLLKYELGVFIPLH